MVPGQSHEHGLAAAFLGQEELARGQVGVHGDGVGSLKIVNGQPEGLGHVDPGGQVVSDLQRDDFGVRGDRLGNHASGCFQGRFEFQVVVDVAVEAGVDNGAAFHGGARDGIVHRVAVGLGDGAHRGPARMGRHGVKGVGRGRDLLQDGVLLNLLAQEADIVSQAADFGGDFIDHRQATFGLPSSMAERFRLMLCCPAPHDPCGARMLR
jgi:hypothetical protein